MKMPDQKLLGSKFLIQRRNRTPETGKYWQKQVKLPIFTGFYQKSKRQEK